MDWEFTLGVGGAAGIGYDFGVIRLDGGVSYLSTGIMISRRSELEEDANEDTFTLLAATGNAWYDIDTGSPWTLYFGGGFGTANLGIHLVDIEVQERFRILPTTPSPPGRWRSRRGPASGTRSPTSW